MAIQMRRGLAADFNPSKMMPGEWAVSQDNEKLYMCFTAGRVIEIGSTASIIHYIEDAEAWAIGTRNGVPVDDSQPQYQNNSKYYAEDAGVSATNAASSELNAATSESNAEAWAVGERGTSPVPSTDPTYENNSRYYANMCDDLWTLMDNAIDRIMPVLSVDYTNGHMYMTGSYFEWTIDNNGHLNWALAV